MTRAYLSLGANLGDAAASIREAVRRLSQAPGILSTQLSPLYRTAPQGVIDQPDFINAALAIDTSLSPDELLSLCQSIEVNLGRVRTERWGPRTIDIDIILFGTLRNATPLLTLPHPRFAERAFVLRPLLDLEPTLEVDGTSVAQLLKALPKQKISPLGS